MSKTTVPNINEKKHELSESAQPSSQEGQGEQESQQGFLIAVVSLFIICGLGVALFSSGLAVAVGRWAAQPEYSHGYLIPLVSLYILWERRIPLMNSFGSGALAHGSGQKESRWTWWGLLVCLTAIALLIVGEISALFLIIHYAFVVFLLGVSLIFLGRGTRYTLVPIGILLFAVPLPYIIEVLLTAKMQLISSSLGVEIIRLFNIPVYLSGNIIDLGSFKLHVVEACSGLRYLFPLTCIGFLAAYFYQAPLWRRIVILVSTIPITIVMNSLRIALTGVLMEHYGNEVAEGFLHDFEGWVVFVICMAVLLGEIVLLEHLPWIRESGTKARKLHQVFTLSAAYLHQTETKKIPIASVSITPLPIAQYGLLGVALIASIITLNSLDKREERKVDNISFATFPMNLGAWQGRREILGQDIVDELQISDYLMANYRSMPDAKNSAINSRNNQSNQINFYVAYYDSQRKGVSPHSPKVCIPGGGWEIAEFTRTQLNNLPVNRVLIRKGENAQLVYYWFVERGEVVANEYFKKWMLLRDAISKNRTDGSLVRVVTPVLKDEDIEKSDARIAEFMAQANPKLMQYLPGRRI